EGSAMNLPHPRSSPRAGFTLVEATMAGVLLTIALMSTFGAMTTANQVTISASHRSRVMEQVQKAIEQIQATQFGTFSTATFTVDGVLISTQRQQNVGAVGRIAEVSRIPYRTIRYLIEAVWLENGSE